VFLGRKRDFHHSIKAPRATNGRVQHVLTIGGGHPYHAFVARHAIHFHEQLVQRCLFFAGAVRPATSAAYRVELVDEHDTRGTLSCTFCERANPTGAHANVHLREVGTRGTYHRNPSFAGHGACKQRLAGTRRTDEQNALGAARAHAQEALRLCEKGDYILEVCARLTSAAHVIHREMAFSRCNQETTRRTSAHAPEQTTAQDKEQ